MNLNNAFPQGPITDQNGNITLEWRFWLQAISPAINNIVTLLASGAAIGFTNSADIDSDAATSLIPGPQGTRGETGAQGAPGQDGDDGEDAILLPGAQGEQGIQGMQGQPGLDGAEGEDAPMLPGLPSNNAIYPSQATISQWADFIAQAANPPAPAAGAARFHAATTQGFTRFEQDNEAATNLVLGRDNVFIAKNTTVSTIAAMTPVYVTGSTGNVPDIGLAKADVVATLPAVGLTLDSINANAFGQVMRLGVISNVNTNAYATGNTLWVDATTAGALTATRPVSPNLAQAMAIVLVKGVGNGSLLVITAPFVGGLESGTTSAWLAASTIQPAQATPNAYLSSDASPGISTTITSAGLVGKTITVKDGIITGFA